MFNCILNLIGTVIDSNITPKVVFIDGPGGTGKTFLFNAILDAVRRKNQIAIAVAHSGTAATLLKGGRTAHSTFRIPLEVSSESTCNITANSDIADLLRQAKVVLWDEASMISKDQIGTVDRTLRDIMKKNNPLLENVPFGGKLFVFGGDFRQVLPVVPNATRAGTVDQCLNRSSLWRHVQVYRLATNMRVQQALSSNNPEAASALQAFADYLLTIGNGSFPSVPDTDLIRIPDEVLFSGPDDFSTLANHIYNNFRSQSDISVQSLTSKAILTPKNVEVSEIKKYIMDQFPGDYVEFYSADKVMDDEHQLTYPVEYLNTMNPGSLPPHHLKLKVGAAIMVLRNLSSKNGVCNGTRLICRSFKRNVIEAEIATGPNTGQIFLVPRIDIISNENQTVIPFRRKQFPIRPAFAMTINKAQGQTLVTANYMSRSLELRLHSQLRCCSKKNNQKLKGKMDFIPETLYIQKFYPLYRFTFILLLFTYYSKIKI